MLSNRYESFKDLTIGYPDQDWDPHRVLQRVGPFLTAPPTPLCIWRHSCFQEMASPDMTIELDEIQNLVDSSKGWPVTIRDKTVLDTLLEDATLKVAVIGHYNRGKTHILNKLAGKNCQSSALDHTKGLNVLLNGKVAYLDTAGENQPILQDGNDTLEAQIKRRVFSSQFLMDLVIAIADVVVIVVNQLTFDDQRYIAKVAQKMRKVQTESKSAQIIICHNFKDAQTNEDVAELINRDVVNTFDATPQIVQSIGSWGASMTRQNIAKYWKSETFNGLHYVFAAEDGQAAKIWNKQSLSLIHQSLQHRIAYLELQQTARSLFKIFIETCLEWFPIFFQDFPKTFKFGILEERLAGDRLAKARFVIRPANYQLNDISVGNFEIMYRRDRCGEKRYELDYKIYQDEHETLLYVEIPGVFNDSPGVDENITLQQDRHNFEAVFIWTRAGGNEILRVTLFLASGDAEPGIIVRANRADETQGALKEQIECQGTAAQNCGQATLNVHFKDHFPKGPQQFMDPEVKVELNGLLKISLRHVHRKLNV